MNILKEQETSGSIELLAAQRNIYSRAKNIIGFQMFLSVPVAICAATIVMLKPEFKGYVAIWGLLVVVFDLFVFTPWVKKMRDNAARIQEVFDTRVFELEWNEIAVGKRPEYELVYEEAKKHGLEAERVANLREWYPTVIDKVPSIFGIVICQRANIYWDARMRLRYCLAVRVMLVLIALGVMGYGLYTKKDMFEFLAYICMEMVFT